MKITWSNVHYVIISVLIINYILLYIFIGSSKTKSKEEMASSPKPMYFLQEPNIKETNVIKKEELNKQMIINCW